MADLGAFTEDWFPLEELDLDIILTNVDARGSEIFSKTKTITGTVRDHTNTPTSRVVRAYRRRDGALLGSTTSDPTTGEYSLDVIDEELYVVVADDVPTPLLNDLIARVIP